MAMRRLISLLVVGSLVIAANACAPNDAADPERAAQSALIANRNLDILFMVDNSSSMRLSQDNLQTNFPMFMDVLKNIPGGLPNIHVAVISSDMGAGDGSIASCSSTGGDNGIFQYTARGTCTNTTLQAGATYISNVGGTANYSAADISTVFSCIAALGETGCGFEHQFASILRALGADGHAAPAENQGFLRSDALLAIVMITNEDDCSERPGSLLFDTGSNITVASTLGPPANFRCNEFGHVCNGAPPPRMAPNQDVTAMVPVQNCTSSECDGQLTPVGEFVARIKALKASPANEILMAAITGPATPYVVTWKSPSTMDTSCGAASCPWPVVAHSCTATDGRFADPSVRIAQAVSAFGTNGFLSSICDANFGPALQAVASHIGSLLVAGGGSGGSSGTIPTCAPLGGAGGAGGRGGFFGTDTGTGGTMASGGMTGSAGSGAGARGGTTGVDAGVDGVHPKSGGGWCQVGGAGRGSAGVWLAGVLMALSARRGSRRRGASRRR
jgi:hypothetical protein